MRTTYTREVDQLERNLELLANIGSTAPYVGLWVPCSASW
jgi:biopolymer transport protein TolQ